MKHFQIAVAILKSVRLNQPQFEQRHLLFGQSGFESSHVEVLDVEFVSDICQSFDVVMVNVVVPPLEYTLEIRDDLLRQILSDSETLWKGVKISLKHRRTESLAPSGAPKHTSTVKLGDGRAYLS